MVYRDSFKPLVSLLALIGLVLAAWRVVIVLDVFGQGGNEELWADAYFLLALYGGFAGLVISRYWGGTKSLVGKAIIAFSAGLFLQAFGQGVYTYYALFKGVDAAYPSVGDIGFFGSIPAYIIALFFLARITRAKLLSGSFKGVVAGVVIPVVLLTGSYYVFLRDYAADWSNPIAVILDFAYPLGQASYLSIAIIIMLLSAGYLGGIMKKPLSYLVIALFVQYLSDFVFLYRFNQDSYVAGGLTDILYFVAYFVMGFSLIYLGRIFQRISSSSA